MKKSRTNEEARAESLSLLRIAGWNLFSRKGYRATTVEEVAREAGLTKGAVYFYFGNKDKFAEALISEVASQFIDDAISGADDAANAQTKLIKTYHKQVAFVQAYPLQVLFLIKMAAEIYFEESDAGTLIRQKYEKMRNYIENVVIEGRATGEFTNKTGVKELASYYMAAQDGMMLEWARLGSVLNGREIVRIYRAGLLHLLLD